MIKKVLAITWYKKVLPVLKRNKMLLDIFVYSFIYPRVVNRIKGKARIKVVFFPINIGMWKNDYLFELMMQDPRFDPYIVSFFVPDDSLDYQRRNQDEMRVFFKTKGYPYYDLYDFSTGKWFDIKAFKPDVVFYTQAVNKSYKQYRIQSLWKRSLFYYIPYCLLMEQETITDNTLLFNISVKVFAPSDFHKKYWSSFVNKGRNVVVTGYPSFDYLTSITVKTCSKWKCNDGRKRVIWAPHHSIEKFDLLSYSNFLLIADDFLQLVDKYVDSIEFVFKPHPRLRPKLEKLKGWGPKRTEEYYTKWATKSNTSLVDGDYYDLFLTSDAMIHDCSTFMAEYLLTEKPVMFNLRDESALKLNVYAQGCYRHHYVGKNLRDIEFFLDKVVLEGDDYMRADRLDFVKKQLISDCKMKVATRIFNEMKIDLL